MKKLSPKQIAIESARIAKNKKSRGVIVLDIKKQASYCDYFVLASVDSKPQMDAVEGGISSWMKENGVSRYTHQQMPSKPPSPVWRVLDFGATVIHIMTKEARSFYSLEKIMHKAKRVSVTSIKRVIKRKSGK